MSVGKLVTGILLILTLFPAPQFVQALSIPTSTDTTTTSTTTTVSSSTSLSTLPTTGSTATIDTTGPVVSVVAPRVAIVGTAATFSATVSDGSGTVSSCLLILVNSAQVTTRTAMTVTALAAVTTASASYTFKDAGKYVASAACKDPMGNATQGSTVVVVVSAATTTAADTTAPTIGTVTPSTATVGTAVSISATVSDDVSVSSCSLILTNSSQTSVKKTMTLATSVAGVTSASFSHTFKEAGTVSALVGCADPSGNRGNSVATSIVVSAAASASTSTTVSPVLPSTSTTTSNTIDTTGPTVGVVSPLVATVGTAQTFSTTVSDSNGISSCFFVLTNSAGTVEKTAMTVTALAAATTASLSYTFKDSGSFGALVSCKDPGGNAGAGKSATVVVSAAASTTTTTQTTTSGGTAPTTTTTSTTDTLAPKVSAVSPLVAIVGTAVKLVSAVSDDVAVVSCGLALTDSAGTVVKAAATLQQGTGTMTALLEKTFRVAGTYGAVMTCLDAAKNSGASTSVNIVVSAAASTTTQTPTTGTTTTTTQTPTSSTEQTSTATDTVLAVGQLTPVLATVGTVVSLKAPISGATTLDGMVCTFVLTNSDKAISTFAMTTKALPAITIATIDFTFKKAGVYTASAACTDSAGTSAKGKPVTITVGAVSTTTPATGTGTTTNSTTTTDTSTTPATGSTTTTETGTTPASTTTTDSTTTTQTPATTTTTTTPSTSSDVTVPVVGSVTPIQTTTGVATTFSATVSDDSGETGLSCVIAIAFGRTPMAKIPALVANGTASAVYKFAKPGSYFATVLCSDAAKNRAVGTEATVVVADAAAAGTTVSVPAKSTTSTTTTQTNSGSTTTTPGTSTTTETSTTGTSTSTTTTAPETTTTTPAADTLAPMIGKVIPKDATVGFPVRISAIATDNVAVTSCTYSLDEVDRGLMTLDKGMVYADYSFINIGDHTIIIFCADAAGNVGKSKVAFIRVGDKKDTTAPLVGTIPAVTAVVDAPVTVSVTYVDNIGVTKCTVYLDKEDAGSMALSVGVATATVTVSTDGLHTLYVGCVDAAGNVGASVEATTFDVAKATGDLTVPTIGSVSPLIATQNSAVTFSVSATDDSGVSSCSLFVDNANQGDMVLDTATPTFSRSYTFAEAGTFSVYADCIDAVGNDGIGGSVDVVVSAAEETLTDTVAPTVGAITPSSTIATVATTLSASVSDSEGVTSCELYVDSVDVGAMTVANGTASYLYTFTQSGTAVANAYCKDAAGNATQGDSTFITVEDAEAAIVPVVESVTNSSATAEPGNLIKLACYSNSDVNDPCKAVYFYSAVDGSRHVFPNENAYFTWFTDFDSIVVVSDDFMKSLTIGENIVYRPGVRLVKFDSMNKVYAVTKGGVLRPIDTETTAAALYGTDWAEKVDGISDAFFSNYQFGEEITSSTSYNPGTEESAVPTIDSNLQ